MTVTLRALSRLVSLMRDVYKRQAVRKLKQCFTRMMFEAGLLESSAKPRTIKPIHIDYRTEELLTANGLGEYLKAVKGV